MGPRSCDVSGFELGDPGGPAVAHAGQALGVPLGHMHHGPYIQIDAGVLAGGL